MPAGASFKVNKVYEDGFNKKAKATKINPYNAARTDIGAESRLYGGDSDSEAQFTSEKKTQPSPYHYANKAAYMVPTVVDKDDKERDEINLNELNELLGLNSGMADIDRFVSQAKQDNAQKGSGGTVP